jgi:large subunit ribosomal protein L6
MSRIGKKPVVIPSGVKVAVGDNNVSVEGKAKLSIAIPPKVTVEVQDSQVIVNRLDDTRESGAMQGLARSLINNMVVGVTEGFKKELLVVGVGYRAQVQGKTLNLSLGFSHPVDYKIPEGLEVAVEGNKITVSGADKQLVGEAAATIRRYRKPEPYKGKGVRYADEYIAMKEGKTVG